VIDKPKVVFYPEEQERRALIRFCSDNMMTLSEGVAYLVKKQLTAGVEPIDAFVMRQRDDFYFSVLEDGIMTANKHACQVADKLASQAKQIAELQEEVDRVKYQMVGTTRLGSRT